MGLSFFAPLFFAGAALLAAPYLIHQIRRPERETLRFSSLLFIPDVTREVIERRKIQHIILMLLRMLLFLLLALAFARPYWKALAAFETDEGPSRHVILLDVSYSMGAPGVFEKAQDEARALLNNLTLGDRVGVVVFARSYRETAPLRSAEDTEAGGIARARAAIGRAEPGEEDTDYVPALRFAQNLLTGTLDPQSENQPRLVLHVVSDFRKNGMPERHSGWKLAPAITLHLVEVDSTVERNFGITDIGIRKSKSGDLRILGKIKNWSTQAPQDNDDAPGIAVTLFVNGSEIAQNKLAVKSGNASQTSFQFDHKAGGPVEGWLQLSGDELPTDDRRYFTWNAPRKKRILIAADERPRQRWPAGRFFAEGLDPDDDLPWRVDFTNRKGMLEFVANPARQPAVIFAADLDGIGPDTARLIVDYARSGGKVLLVMNGSMDVEVLNSTLLDELNLSSTGTAYAEARGDRFDMMSWIDLDHGVFTPFSGAQFNDFSSLRFHNHFVVDLSRAGETARAMARYEDDSPAMIDCEVGEGRIVLWTFDVRLDWTNLPKNPRFVPLLYETAAYLTDLQEGSTAWSVGGRLGIADLVMNEEGASLIAMPGESGARGIDGPAAESTGALDLHKAGFFRTRAPEEKTWQHVDAINVVARESDPTPISLAEFELKLASSPVLVNEGASPEMVMPASHDDAYVREEYGKFLIIAFFLLLAIECWYMSTLKR